MKNSFGKINNQIKSMTKKNPAFYFIIFFSLAVLVLLLVLLGYSANQYITFKKTEGKALCGKRSDVCTFTFDYTLTNGKTKTYVTHVSNYYGDGNYSCNVYYKQSGDKVFDVVIPAFSYTIFLGTVANIVILSILSFFALINLIFSFFA